MKNGCAKPISPERAVVRKLQGVVAGYYGQPVSVMTRRGRFAIWLWPRNVAIYFARQATNLTLADLGSLFGNRAHVTILDALHNVETRAEVEVSFRAELRKLEQVLRAAFSSSAR
jgi:chromosomal replication initiator protein